MTTRGGLQDNNNDTDSSTNSELELIALCYYYEWRFIQEILFFFGEQKWTKKEAKEDKKTNEREKKQRSPLRLINHHKTHTLSYTLYIFKTPWASRSRNCSSASFRRRKCAF